MFWIQFIAATLLLIPSALLFAYLQSAERVDSQMRATEVRTRSEATIRLRRAA